MTARWDPCTSHSADWATPTPGMPMMVEASRHTHSPTAGRCRYTVRSGLMKTYVGEVELRAHPVAEVGGGHHPLQRGHGSSPATTGTARRTHTVAGPRRSNSPAT